MLKDMHSGPPFRHSFTHSTGTTSIVMKTIYPRLLNVVVFVEFPVVVAAVRWRLT
jgi:hypothetical protein